MKHTFKYAAIVSLVVICAMGVTITQTQAQVPIHSYISSNFNGTAIAGGNYIWFNAILNPPTLTAPITFYFVNQTITFTANSINYVCMSSKGFGLGG